MFKVYSSARKLFCIRNLYFDKYIQLCIETGLNCEPVHKNTAVSKRHCKGYFCLDFFVGKESMCHMQDGLYFLFCQFPNFNRQDDWLYG